MCIFQPEDVWLPLNTHYRLSQLPVVVVILVTKLRLLGKHLQIGTERFQQIFHSFCIHTFVTCQGVRQATVSMWTVAWRPNYAVIYTKTVLHTFNRHTQILTMKVTKYSTVQHSIKLQNSALSQLLEQ